MRALFGKRQPDGDPAEGNAPETAALQSESAVLAWQRKLLRMTMISTLTSVALVIMMVVLFVTLVPKTSLMVDRIQGALFQIDRLADDAQKLIDNTNKMVEDNTGTVTEIVKKLNEVRFDELNEAISDLNTAIHPLAEFAKLFE